MKLLTAFFRLIRWPNLIFIAITQLLFMYCVLQPLLAASNKKPSLNPGHFFLLIISSVFIAAAGYIINDYFDLNIDRINKPKRLIVQKIISRRWTILWHFFLSMFGVAIGFYLDLTTHVTLLGFSNLACACLLFLYSISLKKKLLSGNILISLLTAWTVLVVTWCEARFFLNPSDVNIHKIIRITFLYTGFAFVISLIREAVKDMEDIDGDRRYGCKTMPIVWGFNAAKIYAATWMAAIILALVVLILYMLQIHWWLSSIYCLLLIITPLVYVFQKLFKAKTAEDFHKLSSLIKLVMFTGILSMIFFRIYT
ncbi:MAG: geranylgeranylglycerol-phosphate geranylgeranyltransferase [Parafilimonas sp.]|nr:geranylgeranylglycerol-phosphate geranylgeranyltransferase [Parafilimonas sp.]